MQVSEAESALLFKNHKFQTIPTVELLLVFPISDRLSLAETDLLHKLLQSLGFKMQMCHYVYADAATLEVQMQMAIKNFSPAMALIFGLDPQVETVPILRQNENAISVFLPDIHKIESDLECKKAVWKVLKPLGRI